MTSSLLKIISFVVHFINDNGLILPWTLKLRHDFPHVIFIKKVASLLYPSLSCKVSCLALTFDSYFSLKKMTWVQLYKKEYKFLVTYFYAIQIFFFYNMVLIKFNSSLTFYSFFL
jgi:hypothetical protein